jgi:hypothetical protein
VIHPPSGVPCSSIPVGSLVAAGAPTIRPMEDRAEVARVSKAIVLGSLLGLALALVARLERSQEEERDRSPRA